MSVTNALAGVAVSNLTSAIAWYRQLLGRGPDERPMAEVAEWGFDKGGWVQLFEDKFRAGRSSVTLVETDLKARLADLKTKGIEIASMSDGNFVRTAIVADPDGNQIVFAEAQSSDNRAAA
jgi:catechol 2,3-dioxygenase-like lactoylglutathione lyase family enzyme